MLCEVLNLDSSKFLASSAVTLSSILAGCGGESNDSSPNPSNGSNGSGDVNQNENGNSSTQENTTEVDSSTDNETVSVGQDTVYDAEEAAEAWIEDNPIRDVSVGWMEF